MSSPPGKFRAFLIISLMILLASQPASALPRCYTGCTANDVQIIGFSLMPSGTCAGGTTSADLYLHFITNRVNVYCVYVVFDIYTDNNQLLQQDVSVTLGDFNTKVDLNQKIYTIMWPCGKNLYVRNIYVQWNQNSPCAYDCSGGTGSKCSRPADLQVIIPGIDVTKVVSGQCEAGTTFPVSVTGTGYFATHTFDCSGGHFIFTNVPVGTYTVTETVPTGWTATGSPQSVTTVSGTTSTATITNTRDTGGLTVFKVVSGQCEAGTTFPVSISGPGGYSASHIFTCSGGSYTFTGLPTGSYTITETVPTGWTASGSPQTVTVSKGVTIGATVTNTRDTGNLTVTKAVSGWCESGTSFQVVVTGPGGYLNSRTFTCTGGSYTFTNLPTGSYTITETVPTGWTATGTPQTVTVSKGTTVGVTVTNTRDTGNLTVFKAVSGQCEAGTTFPVLISGPGGYSASYSFTCTGGSYTFTGLPTGSYTITETVPTGWTASGSPQTITVSKGTTVGATATNTRDTGSLTVFKAVSGQCEAGTLFPVSISGPGGYSASHTFTCTGGSYTFTGLPTGTYTISETVPADWTATGSPQTAVVYKGVTVTAGVSNTRDTGNLMVTKTVTGQCDAGTLFPVSISGPGGYSASHTFTCTGGSYTFTGLPTGTYTISETPKSGWTESISPQTVAVSKGATSTAAINNSRCQAASAGDDAEICSGYPVILTGTATDATSVSWTKKTASGTLVWPYDGSVYKAAYTPPLSGESEAVLTFTAYGACPDVSDDVTIYVVMHPIATITVIEPQGWT
jgi:hypothetical protein